MERGHNKIYWKRITKGSVTLTDGTVYVYGEVFAATVDEIPSGAHDVIKQCTKDGTLITEQEEVTVENKPEKVYTKQPRGKNKAWWDVIDAEGNRMNTRAISAEDADKLITELKAQ